MLLTVPIIFYGVNLSLPLSFTICCMVLDSKRGSTLLPTPFAPMVTSPYISYPCCSAEAATRSHDQYSLTTTFIPMLSLCSSDNYSSLNSGICRCWFFSCCEWCWHYFAPWVKSTFIGKFKYCNQQINTLSKVTKICNAELYWPSLDLRLQGGLCFSWFWAAACTSHQQHFCQAPLPCTLACWLWGCGLRGPMR